MIQRIAVALAILASMASAQIDMGLCDNLESIDYSSVAAFATNGVLACWQKNGTDYEIRLQVNADSWMGMGLSSNNQMPDTDIYWLSYMGSTVTLQNRYASARSTPAVEEDSSYLMIQSTATDGNTAQVIFKRPIVGSGNRMSMAVSAYVLMATGVAPSSYHEANKLPSASPIEFGTPAPTTASIVPTNFIPPSTSPTTASPTYASPTCDGGGTCAPTTAPSTPPTRTFSGGTLFAPSLVAVMTMVIVMLF